jgi:enterochelin esterase-like enzyme
MLRALAALALMLVALRAAAQEKAQVPQVSGGTIVDLGILQSRYADPRRVVVWLPEGYRARGPKYAVLYMHDGQNLFDKATAGYGMEWQIDETLGRLIRAKKVRSTIVVGIWKRPSACRNMCRPRRSIIFHRPIATKSARSTAAIRCRTAISSSSFAN